MSKWFRAQAVRLILKVENHKTGEIVEKEYSNRPNAIRWLRQYVNTEDLGVSDFSFSTWWEAYL